MKKKFKKNNNKKYINYIKYNNIFFYKSCILKLYEKNKLPKKKNLLLKKSKFKKNIKKFLLFNKLTMDRNIIKNNEENNITDIKYTNIEGNNIKDIKDIKDTNIKDTNIKDTNIEGNNIKDIKYTNIEENNVSDIKDKNNFKQQARIVPLLFRILRNLPYDMIIGRPDIVKNNLWYLLSIKPNEETAH
jgi:hypothetical protein